jgi:hypothetical protein
VKNPPSIKKLLSWRRRGKPPTPGERCVTPGKPGWDEFIKKFPGFDPKTISPKQLAGARKQDESNGDGAG